MPASDTDPFDLQRFVDAQDAVMPQVERELAQGRKTSHWMWFIFPQLAGLGTSPMAQRYGLHGLAEASAYLGHPVLGPRLRHCVQQVRDTPGRTIHDIFGSPDDMKFRSCITLFSRAARSWEDEQIFLGCLEKYFDGKADDVTLARLQEADAAP